MAQIILHPLRGWEPWAAQHQQTCNQNTARCADPIRGKIIQHFGLWALAGLSQKKTILFIISTVKQKVLLRTCGCTLQIKARTGRGCSCCCWAGSARRSHHHQLDVFFVAQGHAQQDTVLKAELGVEHSTHSPVPTEGSCEGLHNALLAPIILLRIIQGTANCIFPSLSHTSHPLHNFQGFNCPWEHVHLFSPLC